MMGLTNAFPDLEAAAHDLVPIDGSPPDLATPPPGCRFQPRCPFALPCCAIDDPAVTGTAEMAVACHRAGEAEILRVKARESATWLPA
jgi:peptide/nickel transport system ATP-binding protein